jgi:hypothetical protein
MYLSSKTVETNLFEAAILALRADISGCTEVSFRLPVDDCRLI